MSEVPARKRKVAFIHPDLGIGGAERLVVDAAVGLQNAGYDVTIYTSHCDKSHCFEEVKNGKLNVEVLGDQLPTTILGKFSILCANLRQLYLTANIILTRKIDPFDAFIIDQLSTCVPFLHIAAPESKVLFYCHFPDQLLAKRDTWLKKIYRVPFDYIEQFTMGASDVIMVNSHFTKSVFSNTFTSLSQNPKVVYPCVDVEDEPIFCVDTELKVKILRDNEKYYLSVNRYERKKNIELAIEAFAKSKQRKTYKLIVSGGYDKNVVENIEYLQELEKLADGLKLTHMHISYPEYLKDPSNLNVDQARNSQVLFLTSVSSSLKELLLKNTEILLYTPSNEHFGIVPLEAMKNGVPVLAVKSGGPLETIINYTDKEINGDATGWLRSPDPEEWSKVLDESVEILAENPSLFQLSGPRRVKYHFSREAMTENFDNIIDHITWQPKAVLFWETILTGVIMFATQYITMFLFPDAIWPYLALAVFYGLVLRTRALGLYWLLISIYLSYMN